ncbi:MAG TPA: signal recognition particle-docking protein FtsY, partial [Synergistaceae bacterium]|nr:signal recognition particle-docking protein FtsY [Synergistaceae bacterium]
ELGKMYRVLERERGDARLEVLLVLDAVMGQNGLAQAETFNGVFPLSGIVLSKYDNTAKGGILLAIADSLKIPVRYVGLGEGAEDLRPFEAGEFIRALLEADDPSKA